MNKLLATMLLSIGLVGTSSAASTSDVVGAAIGGMVLHHFFVQERTVPQNDHRYPQPQVIYQQPAPVIVQQAQPVFPAGTCFQQMVDMNNQPVMVRIPCPVR